LFIIEITYFYVHRPGRFWRHFVRVRFQNGFKSKSFQWSILQILHHFSLFPSSITLCNNINHCFYISVQ